jgi:hypothetical protein
MMATSAQSPLDSQEDDATVKIRYLQQQNAELKRTVQHAAAFMKVYTDWHATISQDEKAYRTENYVCLRCTCYLSYSDDVDDWNSDLVDYSKCVAPCINHYIYKFDKILPLLQSAICAASLSEHAVDTSSIVMCANATASTA